MVFQLLPSGGASASAGYSISRKCHICASDSRDSGSASGLRSGPSRAWPGRSVGYGDGERKYSCGICPSENSTFDDSDMCSISSTATLMMIAPALSAKRETGVCGKPCGVRSIE